MRLFCFALLVSAAILALVEADKPQAALRTHGGYFAIASPRLLAGNKTQADDNGRSINGTVDSSKGTDGKKKSEGNDDGGKGATTSDDATTDDDGDDIYADDDAPAANVTITDDDDTITNTTNTTDSEEAKVPQDDYLEGNPHWVALGFIVAALLLCIHKGIQNCCQRRRDYQEIPTSMVV